MGRSGPGPGDNAATRKQEPQPTPINALPVRRLPPLPYPPTRSCWYWSRSPSSGRRAPLCPSRCPRWGRGSRSRSGRCGCSMGLRRRRSGSRGPCATARCKKRRGRQRQREMSGALRSPKLCKAVAGCCEVAPQAARHSWRQRQRASAVSVRLGLRAGLRGLMIGHSALWLLRRDACTPLHHHRSQFRPPANRWMRPWPRERRVPRPRRPA